MSEGLMGQAIEKYFKAGGKEPSPERRMDYGRLGRAGEMEYQLRFGDSAEKAEAQQELLRITETMRAGSGLEVLDQRVVSLMRGVDVKTATPNDVLDEFAEKAASIAGEIRRGLEAGGVRDEDVLESGPWVVLRAGERAAVKLMAAQGDPRAGEFLEASKPLAGVSDIEAPQREYDVPDWVPMAAGVVAAEVVDALQERRMARPEPERATQEALKEGLPSFALIQQELESLVDNPKPQRERVLIEIRARVLAEAKREEVLDSIRRDVLVAQNSANMDFKQAYVAIRDMEAVQYEVQLQGQRALRPEWEGIVDHYRLGVIRNMEIAMLEEMASRGRSVDGARLVRLRRERSLLGWGNPPPDVRAMAKKYLDDEADRARADAEERRGQVDQRRDMAGQLGGQQQEESMFSPEYVVRLARISVIESMERGEFRDSSEVSNAASGVNVLKAKNRGKEAALLAGEIELAKILTAYEKYKPETVFTRGKVEREEMINLLGVPGVLRLSKVCLGLCGYDVSDATDEVLAERARKYREGVIVPKRDFRGQESMKIRAKLASLGLGAGFLDGLGDLGNKEIFDVKKEDEMNFRILMRRVVRAQIGGAEDDLAVREATAIMEAFVWRYLQLANGAVGEGYFPWCKGEGVRVMNGYQEARDWAIKQKTGGVHTKAVQLNINRFPEGEPRRSATPTESPAYWMFPGNWLSPTLFNPGLFRKEGDVERTLFGSIVREEVPRADVFYEKDVMGGEGFKRGAAVSLDNELYPPDETKAPFINIELDLSKPEVPYAADLAKTVYGMAADFGWLSGITVQNGRVEVAEEVQAKLERLTSVVALARIRMGSDLKTIRLDEYRAKVLSIVLKDLFVEHVVGGVPVKIKIVNDQWLNWLGESGVKISQADSYIIDPYSDYFRKAIQKPLFAKVMMARAFGSPDASKLATRFLYEGVGVAGKVKSWLGGDL